MSTPKRLVLTGGLASGKSTAAKILSDLGCAIVDTDAIARTLLEPGEVAFEAVVGRFGSALLTADGELDRRALREKIFASPVDKAFLENLLHPEIRRRAYAQVERLAQHSPAPRAIVIVVPLLRSRESYPADRVITIEVPRDTQLARAMERDAMSESLAKQMLDAQPSSEERQALADVTIWNTGGLDTLQGALKDAIL